MKTRSFIILVLAASLGACATAPKTEPGGLSDQSQKIQQAGALVGKAHYLAFKSAVRLYAELYARPSLRSKVAGPYHEALLRLALREKEIGIDNPATMVTAEKVRRENAALAGFEPYAVLISAVPLRTRGVMRDIGAYVWGKTSPEALKAAEEAVRRRAPADEFAAGVLASWGCGFGSFSERRRDPAEYQKVFPDSLAIKYVIATCGEGRPELLEELLAGNPEFAELHYHLGEFALREGKLLSAETHLLKAYEAIPESPQTRILLAGIYLATEEFDRSLQFYDLTIEVSPEYRDALLGKAICLSYLGRYEESMGVLNRILDLGFWLLGEAHYWLAWNLHALKRDPEALRHIDEAKGRLPTNSEVFGLAGTLGLELGELERAEKDFTESLKYNPQNTESLFGLGTVSGKKGLWKESADYYEKAARACESSEAALRAKIEDINGSALSDERKARLIRKREVQIERIRLAGATAYFDAASAFVNAGLKDRAAPAAEKSASHPSLRQKARELLLSIRK